VPPVPAFVPDDPKLVFTQDDDGKPYPPINTGERRCPECQRLVPGGVAVCGRCGFNLDTGEPAGPREYTPVNVAWDAGMRPRVRYTLFFVGQAVVITLGLLAVLLNPEVTFVQFLCPWMCFTPLLAFLLGTYARLELKRNERGQVKLTKTWRACFIHMTPEVIPLREYEGVSTGVDAEAGCWEWGIAAILFFGCGVIPGILWWYYTIHRDTYFVALTRDHGFPERMLYRGGNDGQMRDIAETLRDVAELPYDAA
jgi:hypothetical protein